ncbi:hypothetical protein [Micromonospora pattaloongensis]|nr:hypothetical protein [Micromonospora pattaloongensis]
MVVGAPEIPLPMWIRPAMPHPAPRTDQPRPLAVVIEVAMQIMKAHTLGSYGCCAACHMWWGRLAPYPCVQVEWAARVVSRGMTERFLTAVGER